MLRPLTPTSYMLDDSGPRPLPRHLHVPPPPSLIEKPRPIVPDISLILSPQIQSQSQSSGNGQFQHQQQQQQRLFPSSGSGQGGLHSQSHSQDRFFPQAPNNSNPLFPNPISLTGPGNYYDQASHGLLLELITLVKNQASTIERMDGQLQKLVEQVAEGSKSNSPTGAAPAPVRNTSETQTQTEDSVLYSSTPKTTDQHHESLTRRSRTGTPNEIDNRFSSPSPSFGTGESNSARGNGQTQTPQGQGQNGHASSSSSESTTSSPSPPDNIPIRESKKGPSSAARTTNKNQRENTEDLSRILKDLQLPTIQEQSIYSSVSQKSMPYFDLPDYTQYNPTTYRGAGAGAGANPKFNENTRGEREFGNYNQNQNQNYNNNYQYHDDSNGLGPSVSQYGSDSDGDDFEGHDENEEVVVEPTPTFYRNVLGNVNLLLKNQNGESTNPTANGTAAPAARPLRRQRHEPQAGASDTTLYGMTSNNLSFATREYLERHGLVETTDRNAPGLGGGMGLGFQHRRLEQLTNEQRRFAPAPLSLQQPQPLPRTHNNYKTSRNN